MKKFSGYTLLELLVTIVVVSMLMAFGIPAMTNFTQNDRLITQINTLTGHLALARSEALKRAQQVSVCVSSNGTSCTGGTTWEEGWIVYVDENGDGGFTAGEEVLRAQQTLQGGNTLTTTIGTEVTYDYRGFVLPASVGSFTLCDARDEGRAIAISTTGRVRKETSFTC